MDCKMPFLVEHIVCDVLRKCRYWAFLTNFLWKAQSTPVFAKFHPQVARHWPLATAPWSFIESSNKTGVHPVQPNKETQPLRIISWMHRFQICHWCTTCLCQGTCKRKRPNWKRLLNLSARIESKCHEMVGCMQQTQGIRCFTMSQFSTAKKIAIRWHPIHNEITSFRDTSVCKSNTYKGKQWNKYKPQNISEVASTSMLVMTLYFVPFCHTVWPASHKKNTRYVYIYVLVHLYMVFKKNNVHHSK